MIRVCLKNAQGDLQFGEEALLTAWQENPSIGKIWIDIDGVLDDKSTLLLNSIGCHELALSDAQRVRHPPKVEEFVDNTFVLFRGLSSIDQNLAFNPQQIGFFAGRNYLITLHRSPSVSVNEYWDNPDTRALLDSPGRLATTIMHYSAGRYLNSVLDFEDELSNLEERITQNGTDADMKDLVQYRSKLLNMRRVFSYHEKMARTMLDESIAHFDNEDPEMKHAVRDLYDRCERINSLCSMYYENCGDLIEGYISVSSHKLNRTMQVLTVITAIFIPLGFMAGLYGMNFDNMPELHWRYSYFALLGVMGITALTLIILFRRKKWL